MNHSLRLLAGLALLAAASLTGCNTPSRPERLPGQPGAPRPVALRGDAVFFAGKVHAELTISRGRPFTVDEKAGEARPGGGGHRRHGGGGGPGGPPPAGDDGDDSPRLHLAISPLPPVTLRLRLENTSTEPIDIQIRDVNSDLGNFAVRPERLALTPGQSAEVDPMVSQLGAAGDELPVTVSLRIRNETETQQVVVKPVPPAAPAPVAPKT